MEINGTIKTANAVAYIVTDEGRLEKLYPGGRITIATDGSYLLCATITEALVALKRVTVAGGWL